MAFTSSAFAQTHQGACIDIEGLSIKLVRAGPEYLFPDHSRSLELEKSFNSRYLRFHHSLLFQLGANSPLNPAIVRGPYSRRQFFEDLSNSFGLNQISGRLCWRENEIGHYRKFGIISFGSNDLDDGDVVLGLLYRSVPDEDPSIGLAFSASLASW